MSVTASQPALARPLRVAIAAADLPRRRALGQLVAEAGHLVVGMQDGADVVLADGDRPPGDARVTITLGSTEEELPGMLSRDATANQIDAAIRAVAAGLIVRSPDFGFEALRESDGHALLTPRELEVMVVLAEGLTNKAIARRLNISLHTVKFHVESLFRKLGARTRTEAVAKAGERRNRELINL